MEKKLCWKDAFKVHQSTKKKTFDWDADFRLWGTAPSCLSHQSLNLVNWILPFSINNFCLFFGPWTQLTSGIHLYEMHTTGDFFFVWGSNVSEEGLLGLAWNTGEWKWLAIIRPNRFLQLERALLWEQISIRKSKGRWNPGDTKIAPHHEKSLGALETTPSARVVPWSWQVVKYIVNTCKTWRNLILNLSTYLEGTFWPQHTRFDFSFDLSFDLLLSNVANTWNRQRLGVSQVFAKNFPRGTCLQ